MKYAHYDKTTYELMGWYHKDIHNSIPTPNIAVNEAAWKTAIENNANFVDVNNKKVVYKDLRPPLTNAELQAKAETAFVAQIETVIQAEVDRLNAALGVKFQDKYAVKSYADTQGYIYQSQCKALWEWSVMGLYEPMRLWQKTLTEIPSEAVFIAELNKHQFTVTY